MSPDGKSIKEIWRNAEVKNSFGGFVKINDRIYCAAKNNKLKAPDVKTGLVVDFLSNLKGSIIDANNQLYCYTDNGRVNLIRPSGTKLEVDSKFKVVKGTKEHFAHPVIGNGVMYIRHGNALLAYEIR